MAAGGTLVVDTSFLGDVLCAEPLARAVRRRWGPPVDFLTSPGGAEILRNHPGLREILVFDKRGRERGLPGLWRKAQQLRERGYARAVCSHRSWRTALLLKSAAIPERIGFHNASAAWLYTRKVLYRKDLPEVCRNLELTGGGPWERPRMHPDEAERQRAAERVPGGPWVALAPGSIWLTKRWPPEYFAEVLRWLREAGRQCVLLGGAEDKELCSEILALAAQESGPALQVLAGATNLRESAAVLERCAVLLTNDSAPMHLGVAAGIPVIALYCSTLPEFGFAPRGEHDAVLQVEGLPCRPCGIHGRTACPEEHFRCGRDLEVGRVREVLRPHIPAA